MTAMARKRTSTSRSRRSTKTDATVLASASAAVGTRQLVYVHGICRHDAGYSDPWWQAMRAYTPSISDDRRHEVLWSDVITPPGPERAASAEAAMAARLERAQPPADTDEAMIATEIRDALADRAQRQHVQALQGAGGAERVAATEPVGAHAFLVMESIAPQAFLGIPDMECINDFAKYLRDSVLRDQVIGRFNDVVRPLLAGGDLVEVISHSWGTVVAYEALRRMDAGSVTELPGRAVLNFFTVGSALAIPPVKRRLLPVAVDGRRPRVVRTWVNLNAHFDIVGGPLRDNPFEVDYEYLGLPPVGCSAFIPNPPCAHGSYFRPANLTVNRGIFGKHIEGS